MKQSAVLDGAAVLSLEDVSVVIAERRILDRVSLDVGTGEIVTIVGPNGAGKSTLMRVAIGLLKPRSGRVSRASSTRIGYMPQHIYIDGGLPIDVARFLKLVKDVDERAAERVLAETGAASLSHRPMQSLSAGEMRRVLFARALLVSPDLLVLDEPTAGVDVHGQREFFDLIGQTRARRGCAILLVSHDLALAMAVTDRVVCLNQHVRCEGLPEEVSRHPEYLQLFGATAPSAALLGRHDDQYDVALTEAFGIER